MKKNIIPLSIICILISKVTLSQSIIFSIKGGFIYPSGSIDSDYGATLTGSIENKFNKYISLGLNGKWGATNYEDEETFWDNNALLQENDLDIFNVVYSVNLFSKISFYTGDDLILALVPEFGFYQMESRPVIYFNDKSVLDVTHKNYETKFAKDWSYGLHLEGQYYLNEKLNILASIGWNNYDIGSSLNKVDLGNDWNSEFNEKSDFLYFEIGITYLLFGKNFQE